MNPPQVYMCSPSWTLLPPHSIPLGRPSAFLSLNFAIRSWWSEPQSAPGLVFTDCIVSPSSAAKNIINLILFFTIWWCPCVELSLVLLGESVFYDQCVLLEKLCQPLPCFSLYSKAKLACYSKYISWLSTLVFLSLWWKCTFFGVSSKRSCKSS